MMRATRSLLFVAAVLSAGSSVYAAENRPLKVGMLTTLSGPGAALGVIAVLLVAACTLLSHFVIERSRATAQARS